MGHICDSVNKKEKERKKTRTLKKKICGPGKRVVGRRPRKKNGEPRVTPPVRTDCIW